MNILGGKGRDLYITFEAWVFKETVSRVDNCYIETFYLLLGNYGCLLILKTLTLNSNVHPSLKAMETLQLCLSPAAFGMDFQDHRLLAASVSSFQQQSITDF
jgi:hypothetical protein